MNRERGRLRVAVLAAVVTMVMAYPQMQNDIYRKRLPSFLTASRPQRRSVSEYGPPAHVPIYINPYPQVPEDSSSKEDRGPAPPVDGYQNLILGDREPAQQQRDQPPARGPAPPKNAHPPQSRLDEIARQVQKLLQDDQGNVDLNKVPKPVNKPGSKAPGFSPKRRNTMREAENIVKRSGYEAVPKTRTNDGLTIHSSGYNFDGEDLPPTETGTPSYPADEPDQSNYGNNNDGDDGIDEGENTNEGGYPRIQKGYRQKTTTTTTTTRRPTTTTRRTTTTQRTTTRRATPAPTTTKRPAPQRATTTQGYDAPPVAHPPTTTQPPIDDGYGNAVTTTAAGYEANPPAARPKNDDGYGGETVTDGPSESYDEVTEAAAPAPYGGNNIQPEPQPPIDQQYEETHKVDPYAALAEHSGGTRPPLGAHDLLSLDAKAYVEEHKRMQRAMAKKIYSEMRRQLKRELGFGESLSASSDAEHENEEKDASAEKLKGAELPALAGYQAPEPSGYDSAAPAPEPTTVHPDTGYGGEETTVAETTIAPVTLPAHIRTIVANFAKQMEKQAKKTRAEASGLATTPKEFSFDGSADRTTPATPSDGYDTVTQGYEEPVREASPLPPVDEGYGGEETTEAPEPQTTTAVPYEEVTEVQTTPMPHNPYDANEYGGEKKKTEENEEKTIDYNQAGPPGQQPPTGEEEEGGEGAATTPSSSVDEGEGGEKEKPEETEEKGDNNNGGDGTHEQKITYNETEEKPRSGGGAQGPYGGYSASHGAPVAHAPHGTVSRQLVVRQRSLSGGHQKQRVFIDYGDNGRPQIYAKQDQSPTSIQDKASGEQEEEEYPKRRGARFVPFHQVRHLFI